MDGIPIRIGEGGSLPLPAEACARLGLDVRGAQVEVVVRDDGVVELHPCAPDAHSQAWYWSPAWQEREREVDAALLAGAAMTHASAGDLLAALESDRP
jgi:hypothetical protein